MNKLESKWGRTCAICNKKIGLGGKTKGYVKGIDGLQNVHSDCHSKHLKEMFLRN